MVAGNAAGEVAARHVTEEKERRAISACRAGRHGRHAVLKQQPATPHALTFAQQCLSHTPMIAGGGACCPATNQLHCHCPSQKCLSAPIIKNQTVPSSLLSCQHTHTKWPHTTTKNQPNACNFPSCPCPAIGKESPRLGLVVS